MEHRKFTLSQKVKNSISKIMSTLSTFFSSEGIVHKEFVSQRQKVIQIYYQEHPKRFNKSNLHVLLYR